MVSSSCYSHNSNSCSDNQENLCPPQLCVLHASNAVCESSYVIASC